MACSSHKPIETKYPSRNRDQVFIDSTPDSVDTILRRAELASYPKKGQLLLKAADKLLSQNNIAQARAIISSIDLAKLDTDSTIHIKLLNAAFAIHDFDTLTARNWLKDIHSNQLRPAQKTSFHELMAYINEIESNYPEAVQHWSQTAEQEFLSKENKAILYEKLWDALMNIPYDQMLDLVANKEQLPSTVPWLELAIIFKSAGEIQTQIAEIKQWTIRWSKYPATQYLPQDVKVLLISKPYQPNKIALMLPLSGPLEAAGKAVRDGFLSAYLYSRNNKNNKDKYVPEILVYDSSAASPNELITKAELDGANLIIGPLSKGAVEQTLKEKHTKIHQLLLNTPLKTYSERSSNNTYFISLSTEQEAEQAALRAWEDGFRHPITLTPKSDWGERVSIAFSTMWENLGGEVLEKIAYDSSEHPNEIASQALQVNKSNQRQQELKNVLGTNVVHNARRRQDLDMIFMAATPATGRQLKPSLNYYYAYDIPVYSTASIFEGKNNMSKDRDLNGIRFPSMPWYFNKSNTLTAKINQLWKKSNGQFGSLYALGVDTWYLYPRLEQLTRSPGAQMHGETGLLSVDNQHHVNRKLSWQYFKNGTPRALTRNISKKKEKETDSHGMASNN